MPSHPEPLLPEASDPAARVRCPGCQRENTASRRFCGGCGQGLWETCPRCSGEVPLDEQFCGGCGADVRSLADDQSREVRRRLDSAQQLANAHRYDAALAELHAVASLEDPRLAASSAEASRLIAQLVAERRVRLAEVQTAKADAARFIDEQSFAWAVKVLEKIPEPLRDGEIEALLARARYAGKELATLLAEIQEAVKDRRLRELFPKIERVLTLQPDHAPIRGLAEKLRDQIVVGARQRLAEHRYDDAANLLEQVPPSISTPDVARLRDQAQELAALDGELRHSPYATPTTLALAQRLVKLAPANAEAAQLLARLTERRAAATGDRRLATPPWAPPPKQPALGIAVEWLTQITRAVPANDQVRQVFQEHPGEFFVALGLGLQALDRAALDVNLMPPDKWSVLTRLATMPILSRGGTSAWGIDLGGYALKALKLSKDSGGKIIIETAEHIPFSKPLAHPDAAGQAPGILTAALSELASRTDFKNCRVAASFPAQRVLGRFIDLPPLPAKKVASAVEYEARHQIPIDLAELCWGWAELGDASEKGADARPRSILVAAARQSQVEERLLLFKQAGLSVNIVQSDCLALHNGLRFELADAAPAAGGALAVLDLGAEEANFVVTSQRGVWFRSFGLAGDSFTSALVKEFQLTYDQAEQLKRQPERARRYCQIRDALEPLLAQLADEVQRSLASYRRLSYASPPERLLGVGGGFALHGLVRRLRLGR